MQRFGDAFKLIARDVLIEALLDTRIVGDAHLGKGCDLLAP
jgi:hypothetical protein